MKTSSVIKRLLHVVLAICFVAQIREMLSKYMSKQTLNIEVKVGAENMRMSDMTLCPLKPYKNPGFHFNQSAFDAQTYRFDEIFHNQTIASLNEKGFSISEIYSHTHGRCFVLSSEHKFSTPSEIITLYFNKDGPGVTLYCHEPKAELLVELDTSIPGAIIEYEEMGDEPLACLIELELYVFLDMWDGQYSCSEYGHFNEGFYSCAEERFESTMIEEASFQCSVYWYKNYLPENMRECNYEEDFEEIIRIGKWTKNSTTFPSDFTTNSNNYGCPRPCRWYRYRAKCEEVQEDHNSYIEMLKENGTFQQSNPYEDEDVIKVTIGMNLMEETETQQLLYDFSAMIAAIGGSLGLFLGFSCLQCVDYLIEKSNSLMASYELEKIAIMTKHTKKRPTNKQQKIHEHVHKTRF